MERIRGLCPLLVYIAIRYLTQNKSPSKKKGFMSIIEDYPLSGWRDSNSRPPAPKADASFLHVYLLFDL